MSRRKRRGARIKVAAAVGAALGVMSAGHSHLHPGHSHPRLGPGGGPVANRVLGDRMAAEDYGWTGGQRSCLNTLWQGESGWSRYADTRKTGLDPAGAAVFAYGIPQARPATKLPHAAQPSDLGGQSNAPGQIRWGLSYIRRTYGSPCAALAAKRANGNRGY
jgi:hypothetical protein